jgi:hypothetical protein
LGSLTAGLLGGALSIALVMAWEGCGYLLAGVDRAGLAGPNAEPEPARY